MLSQSRNFSDATIRRFLLAQLSGAKQSEFEAAVFSDSQLEQRVRHAEMALIDDYAADRLSANERNPFPQKFLVTADRLKKLEVSTALQRRFAPDLAAQLVRSSDQFFAWPRLAWRIAFVVVALAILFASGLVIRKEPQIVRWIVPKRVRPAAKPLPTPQAAHHPIDSLEPTGHRDESAALPEHEAAPQRIVLRANGRSPVISLFQNGLGVMRLELKLDSQQSATFGVLVTNSNGEVVHNIPEFRVESADYLDFDVLSERLRPGDFQVTLTRLNDEHATPVTYFFRIE